MAKKVADAKSALQDREATLEAVDLGADHHSITLSAELCQLCFEKAKVPLRGFVLLRSAHLLLDRRNPLVDLASTDCACSALILSPCTASSSAPSTSELQSKHCIVG